MLQASGALLFATDDFLCFLLTVLTIILFMFPFQATNENLPPNVIKQLAKELKNLDESPPEGIKVGVNDDDFSIIYADIEGPGMYTVFFFGLPVL